VINIKNITKTAEKEANAHSDEMSIHLGGINLSWFDTAIDEVAGTTLFNKTSLV